MKPHMLTFMLWVGYFTTFDPLLTTCTKMIQNRDVHSSKYPQPPTNLRYNISVRRLTNSKKLTGVRKVIDVVIIWDQPTNGPFPRGYDLNFVPTESGNKTQYCKHEFTAYHAPNIPQTASNWTVPFEPHGMEKKRIHFGCSYEVKLSSFPHPMPNDNYTLYKIIYIPECIEEDCNCQDPLPPVKNLQIKTDNTSSRNMLISWKYDPKSSIEFFIVASLQFHSQLESGRKQYKVYNSVPVNFTRGKDKYETNLSLSDKNEHKITVKAFDVHLCNASIDALVECNNGGFCYCTASDLVVPTDIKITSNASALATIISWHYPGSDLNYVNYFLVTVDHEHPRDRSLNRVEKYHVPISQNVSSTNVSRLELINTTLPCSANKGAILVVKIHAVDYNDCYGPISKQFSFNCQDMKKQNNNLVTVVILILVLIVLILMYILYMFKAKLKRLLINKFCPQRQRCDKHLQMEMIPSIIYIPQEILEARKKGLADSFEISSCRLLLGKEIGKGAFGRVCIATADTINGKAEKTTVAVKQIKDDASDTEINDFLAEIEMMKQVGRHPNVITMLACCTLKHPYCMVMEYVSGGDLLHYLKKLRKEYVKRSVYFYSPICQQKSLPYMFFTSNNCHNDSSEYLLRSISQTSSCGDTNLSNGLTTTSTIPEEDETPAVESDLLINIKPYYSRNYVRLGNSVLTPTSPPPDLTTCCIDSEELNMFALQIAQGMNHLASKGITHRDLAARNVLVDDHKTLKICDFGLSRTGIYVTVRGGKVPLRWLSIEAIRDNKYATESDVWAFGVVLWEICTLGGFPYANIPDTAFPEYLINGNRLGKPDNCSDEIYVIMESCWNEDPCSRPSFSELCEAMEKMRAQSHAYVNFDVITNRPLPPEEVQLTNSRHNNDKTVISVINNQR